MPACNEGATIRPTVSEIHEKMLRFMPNSAILIVEDGSEDDTKEVLWSLVEEYSRIEVHTSPKRKGYSAAVRDALLGIDENKFDYVAFIDSDGQYDPSDFFNLWAAMTRPMRAGRGPPDIVSARRMNRAEPTYRVALSTGLRVLEWLLFHPDCEDITSAFRIMKTGLAKSIAMQVRFSRYNFWLEFTARASEQGCTFSEVPVRYRSRAGESSDKSRVYDIKNMPKILVNELGAVVRTWVDSRRSSSRTRVPTQM